MVYIKCIAILLDHFCESKIVDEQNFSTNDKVGRKAFFDKYKDSKYQCFQIPLEY